jgi:hypothetical protein
VYTQSLLQINSDTYTFKGKMTRKTMWYTNETIYMSGNSGMMGDS